jgi:dTDP-4-dehydrorhamnose reductase
VSSKPKILILGGSGLLGSNLTYYLRGEFDIISTFNSISPKIPSKWIKFDIDDLNKLLSDYSFDVIINCIGLTNVDLCEKNREGSERLNSQFPRKLAEACAIIDCKLIHISTDNFDSLPGKNRNEEVQPYFINVYGNSKIRGERYVLEAAPRNLVFRSNFFGFSYRGRGSLLDLIISESFRTGQIKGVKDVFFNPVSTKFFSMVIRESILHNYQGLYNLSSDRCISKLDFINIALNCLSFSHIKVVPTEINDLNLIANRPKFMCLTNDKIKEILSFPIPTIESMIYDEIRDRIEKESTFIVERS